MIHFNGFKILLILILWVIYVAIFVRQKDARIVVFHMNTILPTNNAVDHHVVWIISMTILV
jgi:hypothetical protein